MFDLYILRLQSQSALICLKMYEVYLMAEYYSIVYKYCIFLMHSSIDGYMGSFQILAVINCALVNMNMHVL